MKHTNKKITYLHDDLLITDVTYIYKCQAYFPEGLDENVRINDFRFQLNLEKSIFFSFHLVESTTFRLLSHLHFSNGEKIRIKIQTTIYHHKNKTKVLSYQNTSRIRSSSAICQVFIDHVCIIIPSKK